MQRYNMVQLSKELGLIENLFFLRRNGEVAYERLKEYLQKVSEGQPLVLSFPNEQLVDVSFADESLVRLGQEIVAGQFGDRCVILEGLTPDSIANIEAAIRLRSLKLALLAVTPVGEWRCVGRLEPKLKQTLDLVAERGQLTAPGLADLLDLAINTASNRLKRLCDQRLIRREYEVSSRGLQYTYYFWKWT